MAIKESETTNPLGQVRHLRNDLHLTETDLADATGASTRTVRRWSGAQADDLGAPRYADRIDDLHAVVAELEDSLTAKGIRQWLRARNRSLGGVRPIQLLSDGKFEPVYEAACSFRDGEYL